MIEKGTFESDLYHQLKTEEGKVKAKNTTVQFEVTMRKRMYQEQAYNTRRMISFRSRCCSSMGRLPLWSY